MQESAPKKAIIIGGGIGGVTAAIALKRAGLDVTVYERAEELREVGSGLPLWTNALRALHRIGLTDDLEQLGAQVTAGSISTWSGDILADLRKEKLLKRLGTINIVVHRAELLALLLKTLGQDRVQLGTTCIGFTQDATGVCARFADGQEALGDVLIGADGIHSVIRTQLFGLTKPRYAGYTCWRGLAHITRTDLETWAWGKGCQFGITPMSQGRVTLLGDAAHAMTPNLGQGACQAIEDAVALGECLKGNTDIATALKSYEKRRVTRVNRIALLAHFIGQAVQWENQVLSGARNTIVRSLPVSLEVKQLMWILDYQP